jgi:hypothetical protein
MSRAFVKEDQDDQPRRYDLPPRSDPAYPAAAAWALLEGANHDSMEPKPPRVIAGEMPACARR